MLSFGTKWPIAGCRSKLPQISAKHETTKTYERRRLPSAANGVMVAIEHGCQETAQ
jgi:hypothetical protein